MALDLSMAIFKLQADDDGIVRAGKEDGHNQIRDKAHRSITAAGSHQRR
jgi:hypothetical protein